MPLSPPSGTVRFKWQESKALSHLRAASTKRWLYQGQKMTLFTPSGAIMQGLPHRTAFLWLDWDLCNDVSLRLLLLPSFLPRGLILGIGPVGRWKGAMSGREDSHLGLENRSIWGRAGVVDLNKEKHGYSESRPPHSRGWMMVIHWPLPCAVRGLSWSRESTSTLWGPS